MTCVELPKADINLVLEFWFDWPVMENMKPQEVRSVFGNIAGSDESHYGGK